MEADNIFDADINMMVKNSDLPLIEDMFQLHLNEQELTNAVFQSARALATNKYKTGIG